MKRYAINPSLLKAESGRPSADVTILFDKITELVKEELSVEAGITILHPIWHEGRIHLGYLCALDVTSDKWKEIASTDTRHLIIPASNSEFYEIPDIEELITHTLDMYKMGLVSLLANYKIVGKKLEVPYPVVDNGFYYVYYEYDLDHPALVEVLC